MWSCEFGRDSLADASIANGRLKDINGEWSEARGAEKFMSTALQRLSKIAVCSKYSNRYTGN
jgi:hypothetical protein